MSQFDMLFGEENYNELNENVNDNDLPDGQSGDENDEDGDGPPIKVEAKKPRAVRNPRLVLNPDRLMGERGIHTIENYFENIKFKGKGHELEDLNNVMKRLEHWAHRLMPKFKFDDSLNKIEKLGRKKQIQTHMYRYRQGMLNVETEMAGFSDGEEDELANKLNADEPIDEMDALLEAQIEKTRHDTSVGSSVLATPKFMGRPPVLASTPFDAIMEESTGFSTPPPKGRIADAPSPATQLSSEQMAIIAENRRKAQEKLKARKAAMDSQSQI